MGPVEMSGGKEKRIENDLEREDKKQSQSQDGQRLSKQSRGLVGNDSKGREAMISRLMIGIDIQTRSDSLRHAQTRSDSTVDSQTASGSRNADSSCACITSRYRAMCVFLPQFQDLFLSWFLPQWVLSFSEIFDLGQSDALLIKEILRLRCRHSETLEVRQQALIFHIQ